ncbi:MAG TPA: hypothetical protein VEA69_25190 [Tepidisphaeraceae bacterium]|nr:hypothetical protein [Tepidisphaeraceae bacterium]
MSRSRPHLPQQQAWYDLGYTEGIQAGIVYGVVLGALFALILSHLLHACCQ